MLLTDNELSESDPIPEAGLGRREKLLWIAAKLFLTKGYSATSVDEIAEAAGTTGPALYRLFDSKQDILEQICLAGMEMREAGVQRAVNQNYDDPHDTLRDLVRARIDFAFGRWGYQVPITMAEAKHLSPAVMRKMDTASEIGTSEWFRCLALIRPKTPTRQLLSTIYSVLTEISYVALSIDDLDVQENVRETLERVALAGLTSEI